MLEALTFVALLLCALGLGTAALVTLAVPREHEVEFLALSSAAGLGLLAVVLGVLALFGVLHAAQWVIPAGAIGTLAWMAQRLPERRLPAFRWPSVLAAGVSIMLAGACLGAIAPVTESDSLAYPFPIALRLAHEGAWRFWPDLARSVYPLSQELLSAALIGMGNERVGLLSAVELVLAAVLILALARRMASQTPAGLLAVSIALGCPAVAFLAASAKEDLLLVMMTTAGALALTLGPSLGTAASAGLFAGLAAGAKYTGAPVALAVVACVPFCCGRERPWSSLAVAALMAVSAGGLWYGVNFARFGNPLVPLMPSLGSFPVTPDVAASWLSGFGYGRGLLDALLAPFRMVREVLLFDAGNFGGRGNWINPMMWLGVPAALADRRRRLMMPLLVITLALYLTWFFGFQVARLLLPAAALLSIPAADRLVSVMHRFSVARYALGLAVAVSVGIVAAVGCLRAGRYAQNPGGFLEHESEHYAAIQWMNGHLDPTHDRVATLLRSSAYLRIPWMILLPDYQVEIASNLLDDPTRLRKALQDRGFTYLFGHPEDFQGLEGSLTPVYSNEASPVGGAHFFRRPPAEGVAVFALK